jgi:hypothetical protein
MTFPCHASCGASGAPGFTPTSIPGLTLWYDFSDPGNTIVSNAFSAVIDKAGSRHLSQSTAAKRPTVVSQNGLNAARFTAASQQVLSMASSLSAQTTFALFMVCRRGGPSGNNLIEAIGQVGAANTMVNWWSNQVIYSCGSAGYASTLARSETGYNTIISNFTNTNTTKAYLNGSNVTGNWYSGSTTTGGNAFGVGDSTYCNGEIAEFGVYSGVALTSQQLLDLQAYLKNKWGTP